MRLIAQEAEDYQRGIVERVSTIRCVLAFANIGVILLDRTVPLQSDAAAIDVAIFWATVFISYAVASKAVLHRLAVSIPAFTFVSALFDVLLAAVLVSNTDGYLSPFNMWFVFAVVAAGFSFIRWLPLLATLLAMGAHFLIAAIPQEQPLDLGVFAVRTTYLFGFAATVASVANYLTQQSNALKLIEDLGSRIAEARNLGAAGAMFFDALGRSFGIHGMVIHLDEDDRMEFGGCEGRPVECLPFLRDQIYPGRIDLYRPHPINRNDLRTIKILVDRFAATVRRFQLTEKLIEAAGSEERLRLADRLHDGFIQTLSAVDMHATVAKQVAVDQPDRASQELDLIKVLAREAASEARSFLMPVEERPKDEVAQIVAILRQRWGDGFVLDAEAADLLTTDQWRAVEMLVREGSNNALRHGSATRVCVSICRSEGCIVAKVAANGGAPHRQALYGYGLSRLSLVAGNLGGSVSLRDGESGGSVLEMRLPNMEEL